MQRLVCAWCVHCVVTKWCIDIHDVYVERIFWHLALIHYFVLVTSLFNVSLFKLLTRNLANNAITSISNGTFDNLVALIELWVLDVFFRHRGLSYVDVVRLKHYSESAQIQVGAFSDTQVLVVCSLGTCLVTRSRRFRADYLTTSLRWSLCESSIQSVVYS
jgi:hypothetical protein